MGGSVSSILGHEEINDHLKAGLDRTDNLVDQLLDLRELRVDDKVIGKIYQTHRIRETISFAQCLARLEARYEENLIETVPLAEALKTRVITKGPPFRTYALKPLQRFLHDTLRRNPCFLIGETISEEYLEKRLGGFIRDNRGHKFLSGDYSDATNKLISELSEFTADNIAITLGFENTDLHHLFVESLTEHKVKKEFFEKHTGETCEGRQCNGQLMGSVTSFPILCIINAALCAFCLEEGMLNKNISLRDLPLCINGDDCLFPANEKTHELWKFMGPICGLVPSVGKYFWSSEFVQMNSRNYRILKTLVRRRGTFDSWTGTYNYLNQYWSEFELIPFVNLRILIGNARSTTVVVSDERKVTSLGTRQRDFILDGPFELKDRLIDLFDETNCRLMVYPKLPFLIPVSKGGLGLSHGLGRMTRMDFNVHEVTLYRSEIGDVKKDLPSIKVEDLWQIHPRVLSMIKSRFNIDYQAESDPHYDNIYGALCLATLMTCSEEEMRNPKLRTDNQNNFNKDLDKYIRQSITRASRFYQRESRRSEKFLEDNIVPSVWNPYIERFPTLGVLLENDEP